MAFFSRPRKPAATAETPVPALQRDHLTLTLRGFQIDREWSADELRSLQARVEDLRPWYHTVAITDRAGKTLQTPGAQETHGVMPVFDRVGFPRDLAGQSVLDIGCNSGFYTAASWVRGATRGLGIDNEPRYVKQALLVRDTLGLKQSEVDFRVADAHQLSAESGTFDFVINTGVVYHLQNPMDLLCRVSALTRGAMFLESEMLLDPKFTEHAWFIEGRYGCDSSNWWIYGPLCLERMARAAGFQDVHFAGFIWRPEPGTKTPEGMLRQGRGVLICRKQQG